MDDHDDPNIDRHVRDLEALTNEAMTALSKRWAQIPERERDAVRRRTAGAAQALADAISLLTEEPPPPRPSQPADVFEFVSKKLL